LAKQSEKSDMQTRNRDDFFSHNFSPRLFSSIVLLFFLLLISMNLIENENTFSQQFLASCILFVCFLPFLIWTFGSNVRIPAFPFMVLLYAVFFSLPVFLLPKISIHFNQPRFDDSLIEESLWIVLIGVISMCVAYYFPLPKNISQNIPHLKIEWKNERKLAKLFIFLGFVGIFSFYVNRNFSIPLQFKMVVNILTDLSMFSIIFLYALILSKKRKEMSSGLSFLILISFISFFIIRFVIAIGNQSVGEVARLVLPISLLYISFLKKFPWLFVTSGLILYVIIRPYKGAHFEEGLFDYQVYGVLYDFFIFTSGAIERFVDKGMGFVEDLRQSWYRLSQLSILIYVLEFTPNPIPFWEGETYSAFFTKIIPRFLYPDKPIDIYAFEFGNRYELVRSEDFHTSVRLPILTEFFINFGKTGVYSGMFLVGLFFRFFDKLFMHSRFGLGEIVIFTFLWVKMFNPEQHLNSSIGSLFLYVPFCFFLHLVVKSFDVKKSV